jgi:hypothetical protein
MVALLVIATIIDVLLAALLVAVSGFILQGVNNTGPMAGAEWYVAFVIFCVAAPIVAWIVRKRAPPAIPIILVLAPIAIAIVALLLEPMFT